MNKSVITATKSEFNVLEGKSAIARFELSTPLSAPAEVLARVEGWGASAQEDFGSLMVSFDGETFVAVQNGRVVLPAGATNFFLAVRVRSDSDASEGVERLAFVVAQTPESSELLDASYYVSSVVSVVDASPQPPRISARDASVSEGEFAVGRFSFDTPLGTQASLSVRVEGYSAQLGADTTGDLQVRINGSGSWKAVEGGMLHLEPGTEGFELRLATVSDQGIEAPETLNFIVGQVNNLFSHSYYVNSLVTITDPAASVAPVVSTAGAPRITSRAFNVQEGEDAIAHFTLDRPLDSQAQVSVRIEGHSAVLGVDTRSGMEYRIDGSGAWSAVPTDGLLTLPRGTSSFQLRVATVVDSASEQPETLNFVVAQIDGSFQGSHYVNSLATVFDAGVAPAPAGDATGGATSPEAGSAEDPAAEEEGPEEVEPIDPDDFNAPDPMTGEDAGDEHADGQEDEGAFASTPKTFTVIETAGVIRFGGDADGAITVLIGPNGEATFSREGINVTLAVSDIGSKAIDAQEENASFHIIGTDGHDTLRFLVTEDSRELFLTGTLGGGADRMLILLEDLASNVHDIKVVSNLLLNGSDDIFGVLFSEGYDFLRFDPYSTFDGFEHLLVRGDFDNVVDIKNVVDPSAQLIGNYTIDQFVVDGGSDLR